MGTNTNNSLQICHSTLREALKIKTFIHLYYTPFPPTLNSLCKLVTLWNWDQCFKYHLICCYYKFPTTTTLTQPQFKSAKVGFDTKITLHHHHPPDTTTTT